MALSTTKLSIKQKRDIQHNDTQHKNKNVIFSIMTLRITIQNMTFSIKNLSMTKQNETLSITIKTATFIITTLSITIKNATEP
jgi:hypothetical protein